MKAWFARYKRSESGQVLAATAVSMVLLVAMTAFVIDVGMAYKLHRRTQAAADASALAAAQMLPDTTSATQVSNAKAAQNTQGLQNASVTPAYSQTYVSNDTVTATAAASTPSVFAKLFGVDTFNAKASATALIGSYTGWSKDIAPWATDKQHINWGQSITFKTDKAGQGNFGATTLDVQEIGCSPGTGGSDYQNLIGMSEHPCVVHEGDVLESKPGNMAGPTKQGLDDRGVIQNFDPYSILAQQPNGSYVLTNYDHPNVVVIPVVDYIGNGRTSYTVVGFAWFIITSYTSKTVTGMFIDSSAPNGATCTGSPGGCPIGGYDPYSIRVVQLIK
jgi:Flp pilus assembly protein TadG